MQHANDVFQNADFGFYMVDDLNDANIRQNFPLHYDSLSQYQLYCYSFCRWVGRASKIMKPMF